MFRVRGKTFETRGIRLNKVAFETLRACWLQQGQPKTGYVFTIDGEQLCETAVAIGFTLRQSPRSGN